MTVIGRKLRTKPKGRQRRDARSRRELGGKQARPGVGTVAAHGGPGKELRIYTSTSWPPERAERADKEWHERADDTARELAELRAEQAQVQRRAQVRAQVQVR